MTRRVGRVEAGLDHDLKAHREIGPSERAALRSQARAVDVGEAIGDPDAVSRANSVYLELRTAAGLSLAGAKPVDSVDAFLAGLLGPTPGNRNTPDP